EPRFRVLACFVTAAIVYTITWGPFLLRQRANFHRDTVAFQDTKPSHVLGSIKDAAVAPLRQLGDVPTALWIGAGAFALFAAPLPVAYKPWKGDWRSLGEYLQRNAKPGEPVVISRLGNGWSPGGKYLGVSFYDASWSQPIVLCDQDARLSDDVIARLRQSPIV